MRHIAIHSKSPSSSDIILFEGAFASPKACIEQATRDNISLSRADLRGLNLSNANLDGAIFNHADFSGSNLSGANLSEAQLDHANFQDCALYNTCFACSSMHNADFSGAAFGGTDIAHAELQKTVFSTLSALDLDFGNAHSLDDAAFMLADGHRCAMSQPPVVVKNLLPKPLILFDRSVAYGHDLLPPQALRNGRVARLVQEMRALQKNRELCPQTIASAL